jgi:hypothetical protein
VTTDPPPATDLDGVAHAALDVAHVESAAIFTRLDSSSPLTLAAAAGIEGPPLDGLVAAVENPLHPITRAADDAGPTFDVQPMNPGGPALRSHLPLGGLGVLAVAHNARLGLEERAALEQLAATATELLRA